MKQFLIIVDDGWNTVISSSDKVSAVRFLQEFFTLYNQTYKKMEAFEMRDMCV